MPIGRIKSKTAISTARKVWSWFMRPKLTPISDFAQNPVVRGGVGKILLLFFLLWLANRAAVQAMDQPFPPRPALFLRLMLMLKPSRFKQLFSNLWVTHPILQPLSVWLLRSSPTPNRSAVTQMRSASSDQKHGNNSMPIVAAMPERLA
jgi:hypothetical protein